MKSGTLYYALVFTAGMSQVIDLPIISDSSDAGYIKMKQVFFTLRDAGRPLREFAKAARSGNAATLHSVAKTAVGSP